MSWIQWFVTRLLPRRWGAVIEAESRAWEIVCQTCGHESNVWAEGGVRYKAAGDPVKLFRCPNCGPAWHRLHKRPAAAGGAEGPR